MNRMRVLSSAGDCLALFRSSHAPLRVAADKILKMRKLNSHERKVFFAAVFDCARQAFLFDRFLLESVQFSSTLSRRQKDALLTEVVLDAILGAEGGRALYNLGSQYQDWLLRQKDRFLQALGPTIGTRLSRDYGEDAEVIAQGLFRKPKKYLAFDPRTLRTDDVVAALKTVGIEAHAHPNIRTAIGVHDYVHVDDLPTNIKNHVWFMDAGSQAIAALVKPRENEHVLDMCAGEGNKARYITSHKCNYMAVDIDDKRLSIAKKRIQENYVKFMVADATKLDLPTASFDWVLLDAPCSGVGTIARAPDIILRLDEQTIAHYQHIQHSLLSSALTMLKSGGKLIYATCSLLVDENSRQIEKICQQNGHIKHVDIGQMHDADLVFVDGEHEKFPCTIFPHVYDCDGFYCAVLIKN